MRGNRRRCPLVVNDRLTWPLRGSSAACRSLACIWDRPIRRLLPPGRSLGPDALIGLSANTADRLRVIEALPDGTLNYLGVGVIREINTSWTIRQL